MSPFQTLPVQDITEEYTWQDFRTKLMYSRLVFGRNRVTFNHCSKPNTGLFLSTGNRYLFPPSTPINPFRLLTTAPRFSRVWRQSFVIEVSDLCCFSPSSSTSDNWASDIFWWVPCRTIPIRFWVDQTHVFSVCTDFPRYHRMESWS